MHTSAISVGTENLAILPGFHCNHIIAKTPVKSHSGNSREVKNKKIKVRGVRSGIKIAEAKLKSQVSQHGCWLRS